MAVKQQLQQRAQSLTERLDQMDQFRNDVVVSGIDQGRPRGFNPMLDFETLARSLTNRRALEGEQTDLLSMIAGLEADEADRAFQREKFDWEKANSGGGLSMKDIYDLTIKAKGAGLRFDPETGELVTDTSKRDEENVEILDLIQDIKDENLAPVTGTLRIRSRIPGTAAYDTRSRVEQLVNKLALRARESMRGTGTVSDFEANMLKQAETLLDGGLSEKAFKQELEKLESMAMQGSRASRTNDTKNLIDKYWGE